MRNYSHSASGIDERTNMNKDNVSLWIRIETPVLLHRMFMLWYGCLGFTPAGEPQGAEIGRNKKNGKAEEVSGMRREGCRYHLRLIFIKAVVFFAKIGGF